MPLPNDQFSSTMKDIRSSRIVNRFKNTHFPEDFNSLIEIEILLSQGLDIPFMIKFYKTEPGSIYFLFSLEPILKTIKVLT
jgi:hypothetical protein